MTILTALLICLAPVATDGDTIRCNNDKNATVRMFGYQSVDKTPADALNKAKLQTLVAGGAVCELTGNSYYRTVGRCSNGFGQDVSKIMLTEGTETFEWCDYSKNYYGTCVTNK
jgi:endonuclease YncB( thermonuclease family)